MPVHTNDNNQILKPFRFKQFAVAHFQSAMKVGTDGVLLGAWASETEPKRILDIGTGTGLIALMLAQRFTDAEITAIEIDGDAAQEAMHNFKSSPFGNRLTIVQADVNDYNPELPFDLIVSNPPYFIESLQSPNQSRNSARHAFALDASKVVELSSNWLSPEGTSTLIFPADQLTGVLNAVDLNQLYLQRLMTVRNKKESIVKRTLIEFGKMKPIEVQREELILYADDGSRSDHYTELTKDFYL